MKKLHQGAALLVDKFETITATDFRMNPGEVFDSVIMGKTFLVTKRGKAVAVISKPPGETLAITIDSKGNTTYEPCIEYLGSEPVDQPAGKEGDGGQGGNPERTGS